jgi:hypothetical protein
VGRWFEERKKGRREKIMREEEKGRKTRNGERERKWRRKRREEGRRETSKIAESSICARIISIINVVIVRGKGKG